MNPAKTNFFLLALLIIVIFTVYANSLNGPFLLDDVALIKNNPLIKNILNIPNFFQKDIFANNLNERPISSSYRPLQVVTYAIDYFLWGANPVIFHLGNILIHILNVLLVFFLIKKLFNNLLISYFVSLLFGIHPVNTQSVTYISGRADILVATFMLSSLICYINYSKSNRKSFLLLSIVLYTLAIFTKESAILNLPLLLFIYNLTFDKRKTFNINSYILYILPILIYFPMRVQALKGTIIQNLELAKIALVPRVVTSLKTLFIDIRISLLPYDLHFGRSTKIEYSIFSSPESLLSALGLLSIFFILHFQYKGWHRENRIEKGTFLFGILWFFLSMVPFLNIVPLQVFHSDNWLYFSSIGVYLILGGIVEHASRLFSKENILLRNLLFGLICIGLLCYGFATVKRNEDYKDAIKFYLSNLRWRPNVKLYRAVGGLYGERKDYVNAIKYLKKAIEINETYPAQQEVELAYYNLGVTYLKMSDYEKARKALEKTLISNNGKLREDAEELLRYIREHS